MRYLPRNNKIYLAEDGVTEIEGPGYEDKRLWIVTFIDPFDFVGMAKGRNMQKRFWETHETGRLENGGIKGVGRGDAEKGLQQRVEPEVRN